MKVSRYWLQKFFDDQLPAADVIAYALNLHIFEIEGVEKVGGDEIIDVNVTANRGHDCLSHRGIAKELAAILNVPFVHDPFAKKPDLSKKTDAVSVEIENQNLCKRYIAGYIRGVQVGPSPKWLRERLESIGQKPINNIVDAANFVMFNTGQPLHAFDASKIKGAIRIRQSQKGDSFDLLRTTKQIKGGVVAGWGRKFVQLEEGGALVITDDSGPIALAGIKGGEATAITKDTTSIIIESANFDGPIIRWASKVVGTRTDASTRFEQIISPELAAYGMRSVVDLILKVAGGELVGYVDEYPNPQTKKEVSVTLEKINNLLGVTLSAKEVENIFKRLGFSYKEARNEFKELTKAAVIGGILGAESSPTRSSGHFMVEAPFERLDLEIPEDLVEEVGRIIGYDKIPAAQLPHLSRKPEVNKNFYAAEQAREEWISKGYSEVYTSVFAEKGERAIANKVDGVRPYLRTNLVDGLREAYEKNKRNAEFLGLKEVRLFEVGTVWKNGKEKQLIGTADKSGVREMEIKLADKIPETYPDLPLSKATRYQPFSKYPFIIRDVAFWTDKDLDTTEIEQTLRALAGDLYIKVFLFDRFEKDDRVSLAYRLVFQSFDRTLTEEEVNPIMEKTYSALKERGFEIR